MEPQGLTGAPHSALRVEVKRNPSRTEEGTGRPGKLEDGTEADVQAEARAARWASMASLSPASSRCQAPGAVQCEKDFKTAQSSLGTVLCRCLEELILSLVLPRGWVRTITGAWLLSHLGDYHLCQCHLLTPAQPKPSQHGAQVQVPGTIPNAHAYVSAWPQRPTCWVLPPTLSAGLWCLLLGDPES